MFWNPVLDSDIYVFIFFQMSGLNIDKDHILEVACLITDGELNMVAEVSDALTIWPLGDVAAVKVKFPNSVYSI